MADNLEEPKGWWNEFSVGDRKDIIWYLIVCFTLLSLAGMAMGSYFGHKTLEQRIELQNSCVYECQRGDVYSREHKPCYKFCQEEF